MHGPLYGVSPSAGASPLADDRESLVAGRTGFFRTYEKVAAKEDNKAYHVIMKKKENVRGSVEVKEETRKVSAEKQLSKVNVGGCGAGCSGQ